MSAGIKPDFAALLSERPILAALGVLPEQQAQLAAYLDLLWAANQELNLVSRKLEPAALVDDHLVDSLLALPYFPRQGTIADLGSGGGLPALPLAICLPETRFLLFEKSPLKCKFLERCKALAPAIEVMGPLDPGGAFPKCDLITARGFKSVREILQWSRAHQQRGGAYLLYKARRARIDEELAEAKLKARVERLPQHAGAEERHLVLIGTVVGA